MCSGGGIVPAAESGRREGPALRSDAPRAVVGDLTNAGTLG
jgi:hypothetical protein